jgi:hypothetical protein
LLALSLYIFFFAFCALHNIHLPFYRCLSPSVFHNYIIIIILVMQGPSVSS